MSAQILMTIDLSRMGETGLVMFFGIFVAVTIWAFTRKRREIRHWSELALHDDARDDYRRRS